MSLLSGIKEVGESLTPWWPGILLGIQVWLYFRTGKKLDGILDSRVAAAMAVGHSEGANSQRAANSVDAKETAIAAATVLDQAAERANTKEKGNLP